jgi:outer membrane receptor protein involved in Fe transport
MQIDQLPLNGWREARSMYSLMVNGQLDRWNINLAAVHHGAREMIASNNVADRVTLPTYWQVDNKIQFAVNNQLSIALHVKNLLNENYLSPPQVTTLPDPVPDRGRQWSLGVTWTF